MVHRYFLLTPIDDNINLLVKSFNPLVLLDPLPFARLEYTKMIESSQVYELDGIFDQPSAKRTKKKIVTFIICIQRTLNDVLYLIEKHHHLCKVLDWMQHQLTRYTNNSLHSF